MIWSMSPWVVSALIAVIGGMYSDKIGIFGLGMLIGVVFVTFLGGVLPQARKD